MGRDWRHDFESLRQELFLQCADVAHAVHKQVQQVQKEIQALGARQGVSPSQQVDAAVAELSRAVQDIRATKPLVGEAQVELGQLREQLDQVQDELRVMKSRQSEEAIQQVQEVSTELTRALQELRAARSRQDAAASQRAEEFNSVTQKVVDVQAAVGSLREQFEDCRANVLEALQTSRRAVRAVALAEPGGPQDPQVTAQLDCLRGNVEGLAVRLEEYRSALQDEVVSVGRATQSLDEAAARAQTEQSRECAELRAMLDSMWSTLSRKAARVEDGRTPQLLKFEAEGEEDRVKEVVGDQEDIHALYDMVKEALGEQVHMKQQINSLEHWAAQDPGGRGLLSSR